MVEEQAELSQKFFYQADTSCERCGRGQLVLFDAVNNIYKCSKCGELSYG